MMWVFAGACESQYYILNIFSNFIRWFTFRRFHLYIVHTGPRIVRAPSPPLRKHKKSVHTPGSAVYTPGSVSGLSRDSVPGSSAKRRLITSPHQQAKFKIPNKHMKPSSAVPRGGGGKEKDGRRVCGRSVERRSGSREAGLHSSKSRSHHSSSYKRRVLPISGLLLTFLMQALRFISTISSSFF